MSSKVGSLLIRIAFGYILIQMLVNAFRTGGWDFPVYHQTALRIIHGEPIYEFSRDQAAGFKYPPWIAPFFLPLAFFSESVAATIWQLFQFFSACMTFYWVIRNTRKPLTVPLSCVIYYGIFHVNFLAGQIQLPLLAAALWGFSTLKKNPPLGFSLLFFSLSTKLFNLFSLIGLPKQCVRKDVIFRVVLVAGALGVPSLAGYPHFNPLVAIKAYFEVVTSKTGNLAGAHQGLPGVFEWLWETLGLTLPVWPGLIASLALGFVIFRSIHSRVHDPTRRFALALALGAAIHPLAFSYTFTWTYPLGAFVIEHVFLSDLKSLRLTALTTLAFILLLLIHSGLLLDHGIDIPIPGARGLGTLLLAWILMQENQ